jgi:hypothetical protein
MGRVSISADLQIATFYCMRQPAGTTLADTGNVDPNNGAGVVAVIDYLGRINTSYVVGTNRVGAGNELDGGMLATTAGAESLGRYWVTGNRYDSAIGWWYLSDPADGGDARLRGNDGYKFVIANEQGGPGASTSPKSLIAIWTTTSIKIINSSSYKSFAVPSNLFDPNIFTMVSGHTAVDLDAANATTFYFVGAHGISRADRNPATGAWGYRSNTLVGGLRYVCLSNDGRFVYAASNTAVGVYDAASLALLNNNAPLLTLTQGNQFRGISRPPVAPPAPTPTNTPTPSPSATGSTGATPTGTPTGTPATTPTTSPTPSVRGEAVPIGAFAVVRTGSAAFPVPNPNPADVTAPAAVEVYYDCGAGCAAPTLNRVINLPSRDYTGDHAEDRALTLNSGRGGAIPKTLNQGRLVISESRHILTLGGYATPAGWNFNTAPQKVEPITFSLYNSGWYNISTGCKIWSPGYRAIYCK